MDSPNTCPRCGRPLALQHAQGLCPACLLQAGFPTGPATEGAAPAAGSKNAFVPPAPAELAGLFPQLQILELIGQGGMGAVYRARQPALERFVALKILPTQVPDDPGFAERFAREARALARLSHPNIVAIYDFGHTGAYHYFLMEYVDGANLRQIERAGKLAPREALQIIPQICAALQFAHDDGVVHRDIKPENILLDKKGRVKIADFGLAKIFGSSDGPQSAITEAGQVMGTPHYMAPEQVERPAEVDHRADIYSLGVVFYEMLTGELPLGKFAHPSQLVPLDARLDDVVMRTLEKAPAQRYQQASEIKTAVETIAEGEPMNAVPSPASSEPVTGYLRFLWPTALLLALLFLSTDSLSRGLGIMQATDTILLESPILAEDANSLTGYAFNQHKLVLPAMSSQGYHWIMQTEEMLADLRGEGPRTSGNDTSSGLPRQAWSSSMHWPVLGAAWIYGKVTHQPPALGIALIAPYANTTLLGLLLLVFTPILAKRFGPWAAALFALGGVTVYPLYEFYTTGYFDAPGLIATCDMLTILCLLLGGAGWLRNPTYSARLGSQEKALWTWLPERMQARRWFVASAVAGGIGLWVSAQRTSALPVLLGLGLGGIVGTGWYGRGLSEKSPWRTDPTLWRLWGWTGAVTSLLCYFLDYAPSNFDQRVEVTLHALAWVGSGDLLTRLCRWLNRGRLGQGPGSARPEVLRLCMDMALVGLFPAVALALGKYEWLLGDAFIQSLWRDYIIEARPLLKQISYLSVTEALAGINILPLIALPMLALFFSRKLLRPWKAVLAMVLIPGLLVFGLALTEILWLGLDCALWLPGLTVLALIVTRARPDIRWPWWTKMGAGVFACLVVLPYPVFTIAYKFKQGFVAPTNALDLAQVVTRDASWRIRQRLGAQTGLIVSGPTVTTWMMYFGGFDGLGSYGLENAAGMKAAAAIYGAETPAKAGALIEKYGVTDLVVFSWDAFAAEYAKLAHGLRVTDAAPQPAFLLDILTTGNFPPWLRPIPFTLPKDNPDLKNQFVLILEVIPNNSPTLGHVHTAEYLWATGKIEKAEKEIQQALALEPNYLPALAAQACAQQRAGQTGLFQETIKTINAQLDQAGSLAFDDRVNLASALADANQASATDQLKLCLAEADEKAVRHLLPDQLVDFIQLTAPLAKTTPKAEEWLGLARSLTPPSDKNPAVISERKAN